jgi:hypothetical protein
VVKPQKVSVKTKGKTKKKQEDSEELLEIIEFAPNLQAAAEIERDSWETTNTLLELQNQTGEDITVRNVTSFVGADTDTDDFDDDDFDDFEAIDTSEPDETYEHLKHLKEVAPEDNPDDNTGFRIVRPNDPNNLNEDKNMQQDIFDILENLENPEESQNLSDLSDMAKLIASLNNDELSTVEMLISGKNFADISAELMRGRGIMIEAVIESLNEKAMDFTGDIIFENEQIIKDYFEEIQSCLKN